MVFESDATGLSLSLVSPVVWYLAFGVARRLVMLQV